MRYFVLRLPASEDDPDPSVVVDAESDADLLPVLRQMLPTFDKDKAGTRHVIAQLVEG